MNKDKINGRPHIKILSPFLKGPYLHYLALGVSFGADAVVVRLPICGLFITWGEAARKNRV